MADYVKQTWQDGNTSYPGSADRFAYMEEGIYQASLLPPGATITWYKVGGVWPARPTSRTDITVVWTGPDPSPAIVNSGTGGMLNNKDKRDVTP